MPAIEVMRKALNPSIVAQPHIIVRVGSRRRVVSNPALFESATVPRLWLTGVGASARNAPGETKKRSISRLWLGAMSKELERLTYTPGQRLAEFPIVLYEGPASHLAWCAYTHLRSLDWGFSVSLEATAIIRETEFWVDGSSSDITLRARQLFERLASRPWDGDGSMRLLTLHQRLDLVKACAATIRALASEDSDDDPMLDYAATFAPAQQRRHLWVQDPPAEFATSVITPPELAHEMVRMALRCVDRSEPLHFGDPAIGRGRFFAELMAQAGARVDSAIGVDIDQRLAETASSLWSASGLEVFSEDFMAIPLDSSRSLIVANPPYLRSQDLPVVSAEWRTQIRASVGIELSPRTDLYAYFILRAHDWMAPGATAVWLIPSEFRFTEYGRGLRQYLSTKVELLRVHSFDSQHSVFDDARTTSTVLVFKNKLPDSERHVIFSFGGTLEAPERERLYTTEQVAAMPRWPLAPEQPEVPTASDRAEKPPILIGDLFLTRRGIATGANEVFVIDDARRQELGVPDHFVRPVLPRARHLLGPVIYARSDGSPDLPEHLWLLDIAGSIDLLKDRYPALHRYLTESRRAIGHRLIIRRRAEFAKQEHRPLTPYLFGYMSRGDTDLPFYLNLSNATYLNNYIGLYPRFDTRAADAMGLDGIQIVSLLRELTHEELLRHGRIYAEGLRKAEPRELARFVLPDRLGIAATLLSLPAARTKDG